jgi:sulfur-carrier protein adenylyltransferase/sulfurtransferase
MEASWSESEVARYHRHMLLPEIGAAGQQKLKAAHVLVVGAGGLGCPAALYLAAAGIGHLCIIDDDRVELSNLHRQVLFDTRDIGAPKAEAAAARLRGLNPDVQIEGRVQRLTAGNALELIAPFDVVVDGSDRIATRYVGNDACVILKKPWVSAAIHRFEGQAMVYVPGAGPCYRCLFPDTGDDVVPNCAQAGVLGVLPAVLGSIQATEAIKLLLGAGTTLAGRFLTYDALGMRFHEYAAKRRSDCAVCGDHPSITQPRELAVADPPGMHRFRPRELSDILAKPAGRSFWALIDVREPGEFDAGHLPGSINIPLASLDSRWHELPADAQPVFLCRSGARSLTACRQAAHHGSSAFAHLEGGLAAWAAELDPNLKVIA